MQGLVQKVIKQWKWNCIIIAFLKMHHNSIAWLKIMAGSKDSLLLKSHYSRFTIKKDQIRKNSI